MKHVIRSFLSHIIVLGLYVGVNGYPMFLHQHNKASSCFDHPSKPIGGHLPPTLDPTISMAVTLKGRPATGLCPGETYDITVTFPQPRAALVTVSQGTILQSDVPRCANAFTTPQKQLVKSVKTSWQVTCSMLGGVEVKVTSGVSATGQLLKTQLGLPVLRLTQCPTNKCISAAAPVPETAAAEEARMVQTAAAGTPGSLESAASSLASPGSSQIAPQPAPQPAAAAAPPAKAAAPSVSTGSSSGSGVLSSITAAAPSTLTLTGAGCSSPSQLGYQCAKQLARGVALHYSLGGNTPDNVCTRKSTFQMPPGASKATMMHFAIESSLQGYLGLGFPTHPGKMVSADAVIGTIDDKTGTTKVGTYRLSARAASGVVPSDDGSWATGLGAVRKVNLTSNSQTTTLCFSRPLSTSAALTTLINPAAVPLIWAANDANTFAEHKLQGALALNMISGKSSAAAGLSSGISAAQAAHGALMLAAFCVLMPAAMLLARHKWMFGDVQDGVLGSTWRHLHQAMQLLAVVCVMSSFGLAMALFFGENGTGEGLHRLYTPHFGLGVAVVALAVVQLLGRFLNPGVGSAHLHVWRMGHYSLGWVTMALGVANCFIGVVLLHGLEGTQLAAWLAPMCVLLGLMGLVGLVLEMPKRSLQRKGRYQPDALSYKAEGGEAGKGIASSALRANRDSTSSALSSEAAADQA